ncbi:beta strand repeat-containing protein [Flavobacterium sp. ABG]|uniref:beta strand repeat-containing protein n=1 Tax=Flavobacterium sp. ABG TaxID=1423322 RepID=UPI00069A4913|nr:hypothetical protein [Flavobacterium sp. ABG]
MAQKHINTDIPNSGNGDALRDAFNKTEDNFNELYANKVDKISGKALSTNDYTTAEKNKLAGIPADAEKNIQSDWLVNDSGSDAFIKNKPSFVTAIEWGDITGTLSDQSDLQGALDALPTYAYVDAKIQQNILSGITDYAPSENAVFNALQLKQNTSEKNQANGYAGLDAGGKIAPSQLPNSVMEYKGVYNATTNTPTLVNGTGNTGDVYRVTVSGAGVNSLNFVVGDYVVYNGTTWEKQHSGGDNVVSVFGRAGVISAQTGDYTTAQVTEVTNKNYQTDNQKLYNDATSSIQTQLNGKEPSISFSSNTQYWRGDKSWQTLDKSAVGLGNVDNTADSVKNVLSATKLSTARNINGVAFDGTSNITINATDAIARLPLSGGTLTGALSGTTGGFTGVLTAPTAAVGTNNTQVATTAYVQANSIGGTGTANFIPKWTGSGTQGNANIYDDAGYIGIGTTAPVRKLHVVDTNGGFFFDGTHAIYNRFKSTNNSSSTGKDLLLTGQSGGTNPDLYLTDDSKIGIGTFTPVGKLNVFTGLSALTLDILNQQNGSISFANNSGSITAPAIAGKSDNHTGLQLIGATNESNTNPDMSFNVRENDNTDFSGFTSSAFRFARFGTTLIDVLRNGNTTFSGVITAPLFNGNATGLSLVVATDANANNGVGTNTLNSTTGAVNFPYAAGVSLDVRRAAGNLSAVGSYQLWSGNNPNDTDLQFRKISNYSGGEVWTTWQKMLHGGNYQNYTLPLTGGTVTGNVTAPTFTGALIGNASTATVLQTARTINGVSFNGSANITINATDAIARLPLSGGTLTGGLVGTTANFTTFTGALVGNASTATLAADATTLATPRNINGVAFDGSANITINATDAIARLPISGGTVTGALFAPTATLGTNNTQVATTAYVQANSIGGNGTANFVPKFTASGTQANSTIVDNGSSVWINSNSSFGTGKLNLSIVGAGRLIDINREDATITSGITGGAGLSLSTVPFANGTGGVFGNNVLGYSKNPLESIGIRTACVPLSDTGTEPLIKLEANGSTTNGFSGIVGVANRPILGVYNYSTQLVQVAADGSVGIGSNNPLGKLDINTGVAGIPATVASIPSGTISFVNGGSVTAVPIIIGRSDNSVGLSLQSGTSDSNTQPDMQFNLRRTDNADFSASTLTSVGFRFSRFGTTLVDILRNGNTTFAGTVTAPTFTGALVGNASTATVLQTARTINGVSFNGSANITINATDAIARLPLSGGTLTGGLVGTTANFTTFTGALVGNASTATLAADATTLATPRNINGVAFDGSANITINAVDSTARLALTGGSLTGALNGTTAAFSGIVTAPTAAAGTNTTQLATTAFVAAGLNLKADENNAALTGVPTAPTAAAGTNTTQIATTAFATTGLNLKANAANAALTGVPTAPTATAGTNTTQVATTAFVTAAITASMPATKVYKALISQAGTGAPTVTVLENTLGTVTFGYSSVGGYTVSSAGLFTANKTFWNLAGGPNANTVNAINYVSSSSMFIWTTNVATGSNVNGGLSQTPILIEVYP